MLFYKFLLFVVIISVLNVSIIRHSLYYFLEPPVLSSGG